MLKAIVTSALAAIFTLTIATSSSAQRWHRDRDRGGDMIGGIIGGVIGGTICAIGDCYRRPYQPYYPPTLPPVQYYPPPIVVAPAPVVVQPAPIDIATYCARRFKTWNPTTGLYFGYDGQYHSCP